VNSLLQGPAQQALNASKAQGELTSLWITRKVREWITHRLEMCISFTRNIDDTDNRRLECRYVTSVALNTLDERFEEY